MKIDLKKTSPTILSCIGAGGVVLTSVLAVWSTPKALRKICVDSKENHEGDPNAYTKIEAIRSAWFYYIPAVATGIGTIVCIFGANTLNKRAQASITSAYALLNDSYQNYKEKLKELYGEEAHQKIVDAITVERTKDMYMTSVGIVRNGTLDFEEHNPDDNRLFYDSFSKRYFESSVNRVIQAEYYLNRDFALGGRISVNYLYELLGLEPIDGGDDIGWGLDSGLCWVDFNHYKSVLDDGLEIYVIDMNFLPDVFDED